MSDIKVTNGTTGKTESKDLDTSAMLAEARKKLGAFMAEGDVFVDTGDEEIPGAWEAEVKLQEIVGDNNSIKFITKKAPGSAEPESGAKTETGTKTEPGAKPESGVQPGKSSPGASSPANAAPIGSTGGIFSPWSFRRPSGPKTTWA